MKHKLHLIQVALLVQCQNKPWMLVDPITVRLSDNDYHIIYIFGLQVSPKRELSVMTYQDHNGMPVESWDMLKEGQTNYDKVVNAIHERIMKVFKTTEVAA